MMERSNAPRGGGAKVTKLRELGTSLGWIVLLFACWLAGSILDLSIYLPHKIPAFAGLGLFCIVAVVAGLRWVQTRKGDMQLGWGWFAALWVLVAILYVIVFPRSLQKADRNDSYDALNLSSSQLLHHHFPYYVHAYSGGLVTHMPGALFLALPFQMLGRVSLQNLFWLGMFMWFATIFFRFRSTALAFVLVMLANAHTSVNILDGADYPINWMYICISAVLFLSFAERGPDWKFAASGLFLGVALSSRPTYMFVIFPLVLAYLAQRIGAMAALRRVALPLLAMTAVTAPFYLYDPAHFAPLHNTDHLNFLPEQLQYPAVVLLIVLAVAAACAGFLVRLTLPRFFLLAGVASAILVVTPGVLCAFLLNFTPHGLLLMGYSDAASCFLSLWAFRCIEDQFAVAHAGYASLQPGEDSPHLTWIEPV
jgi:hypothetical protein